MHTGVCDVASKKLKQKIYIFQSAISLWMNDNMYCSIQTSEYLHHTIVTLLHNNVCTCVGCCRCPVQSILCIEYLWMLWRLLSVQCCCYWLYYEFIMIWQTCRTLQAHKASISGDTSRATLWIYKNKTSLRKSKYLKNLYCNFNNTVTTIHKQQHIE